MSQLSWGKPDMETAPSIDGAAAADAEWQAIDTPKQGTTKLTTTAGTETEASEEGGELVDWRKEKNKYQLEFDLFVKKGGKRPWEDTDGVIEGEHSIRLTPEDPACEGILIDRCTVSVEHSYTTADGILLHYVAKALKPKTGKMVKPYVKQASA